MKKKTKQAPAAVPKKRRPPAKAAPKVDRTQTRPAAGPVAYDARLRIVREVLRGATQQDVAVAFGLSVAAVQKYMTLYRRGGADALKPRVRGARPDNEAWAAQAERRRARRLEDPRRQKVTQTRGEHPDWGTRRIRDVLGRFAGLGVSETTVRRILHEEGMLSPAPVTGPRAHLVRRFERAEPNQLWQSDIFTFLLRRHERLYLAAFMDDHSRYMVSHALAHHQKSSLVIEAFERGVAQYGVPREVLTDQGRQYTAWRGETDFEQGLRQQGIRHIKSRPQHPQTLGKIERFWKTLWDELLSRTVFGDFADCERRLVLYIQHYNFQRPHRGLEGLVPADRFFRAAAHVRAAIESQVQANALRLAQSQPPRKPFYLVGRLGDQELSIAAQGGALKVQMGGEAQTIELKKEETDEPLSTPRRWTGPPQHPEPQSQSQRPQRRVSGPSGEADNTQAAARAAGAEVAEQSSGPRRDGASAVPDGAERAQRREAGDGGGGGAGDLAAGVLHAREQGAGGDAAGTGAGRGFVCEPGGGDDEAAGGRAGGEGDAPGAGEASGGAAAAPGAQGPAVGTSDPPWSWPAAAAEGYAVERVDDVDQRDQREPPDGAGFDERWARSFAVLAEESEWTEQRGDGGSDGELEQLEQPGGLEPFDAEQGWSDQALNWCRKLTSSNAPAGQDDDAVAGDAAQMLADSVEASDDHDDDWTVGEIEDGTQAWPERGLQLPDGAGDPGTDEGPLRACDPGAVRRDDGERGGPASGDGEEQFPDADEPRQSGPGREFDPEDDRAPPGARAGGGAAGRERGPAPGQRRTGAQGRADRSTAGRGRRDSQRPPVTGASTESAEGEELAARLAELDELIGDGGGPRARPVPRGGKRDA
jgi:transposase InsO family protein